VFASGRGNVIRHEHIIRQALVPAQVAAELLTRDGDAKYTGLHALRHFYASWCINRRADGGLELPAKVVQERLGHASIVITMDTYGHLFPRNDDGAELAEAMHSLLARGSDLGATQMRHGAELSK
jgi:integrase